ncbi:MAG: hypothetical protein GF313_04745 [Caldithrix sp.]|nr:hypothetical protein [Caldithrix sp.]
MKREGFNYTLYYVGGTPPLEELRYSTPEGDDARNGLAAYGGLSFIIESGIRRKAADPDADLGRRIDAYLALLKRFIYDNEQILQDSQLIESARNRPLPDFIPVNYFWANTWPDTTFTSIVNVIDKKTVRDSTINTSNFMKELVVKHSVSRPLGYIIESRWAQNYQTLL